MVRLTDDQARAYGEQGFFCHYLNARSEAFEPAPGTYMSHLD
jgi:hypothetical protein